MIKVQNDHILGKLSSCDICQKYNRLQKVVKELDNEITNLSKANKYQKKSSHSNYYLLKLQNNNELIAYAPSKDYLEKKYSHVKIIEISENCLKYLNVKSLNGDYVNLYGLFQDKKINDYGIVAVKQIYNSSKDKIWYLTI